MMILQERLSEAAALVLLSDSFFLREKGRRYARRQVAGSRCSRVPKLIRVKTFIVLREMRPLDGSRAGCKPAACLLCGRCWQRRQQQHRHAVVF